MKKIDSNIIKNIRNKYMKEYGHTNIQKLAIYEHYEFTPHLFSELYNTPGVDKEALSNVCLHNLYKVDSEGEILEGQYEERFILMRNNDFRFRILFVDRIRRL